MKHAVAIAAQLWLAILCSITGRWQLSFVWLLVLVLYVLCISINVSKPR